MKELEGIEEDLKAAIEDVPPEDVVVLLKPDGDHVIADFVIPKRQDKASIDSAKLREALADSLGDKLEGNQLMKEFGVLIAVDNHVDVETPVAAGAMAEALDLPFPCVVTQ